MFWNNYTYTYPYWSITTNNSAFPITGTISISYESGVTKEEFNALSDKVEKLTCMLEAISEKLGVAKNNLNSFDKQVEESRAIERHPAQEITEDIMSNWTFASSSSVLDPDATTEETPRKKNPPVGYQLKSYCRCGKAIYIGPSIERCVKEDGTVVREYPEWKQCDC